MIEPAPQSARVHINGREVRRRRKLLGQNIKPFAGRCGITEGYLSLIENGRRPTVSPQVFGQICKAFGLEEDANEERASLVHEQQPAVKT